jgi:hypothetical protein
MKTKKNNLSKIGAIFLVSIMALTAIGAGYSAWFDTITIHGTVGTGSVEWYVSEYSGTYAWKVYGAPDTDYGVETVVTGNPEFSVPESEGFRVAYAEAMPGNGDPYDVNVVFENLFPCIDFIADIEITYTGTVPGKINDISFEVPVGYEWINELILSGDIYATARCNEEVVELGYQLHKDDVIHIELHIHIPQDNSLMDLSGSFTATFEVMQWNEYVPPPDPLPPVHNLNKNTYYYTIQNAVDDANDGHIIMVAAGTYEEQLTIDISIILRGEDRDTTIVEYPPTPVSDQYLVLVKADDVTITGFKLLGHFATGNRAAYVVHSQGTGLIVENNEIQGHIGVFGNLINGQIRNNIIGTNRKGIYIPGGNNVLNLLIEGNTIEPAEGAGPYASNCGAIYMDNAIDVTIQGNTMLDFSSSTDPSITAGRGIEGSHNSYITTSSNTFENIRDAITMWIVTDIEIDKNTITNSDRYGINIKGQNINIINNEITGSGDSGVRIDEFTIPTQNVNVNFNNIVGNTNYGVKNGWSGEVNAEYNWWGDALGPGNEAGSIGDSTSGNVDYTPWSTVPN